MEFGIFFEYIVILRRVAILYFLLTAFCYFQKVKKGTMNKNDFLSRGLEDEIDKIYSHEIKVKRVKKEMAGLRHLLLENITLQPPKISPLGIRIPVKMVLRRFY